MNRRNSTSVGARAIVVPCKATSERQTNNRSAVNFAVGLGYTKAIVKTNSGLIFN